VIGPAGLGDVDWPDADADADGEADGDGESDGEAEPADAFADTLLADPACWIETLLPWIAKYAPIAVATTARAARLLNQNVRGLRDRPDAPSAKSPGFASAPSPLASYPSSPWSAMRILP
jgi:hypothetical protein